LLDDVIRFSFSNGFVGLEWAGGLPSTVGGAIRGNVGAFGKEIEQVVEKVEVIDTAKNNELKVLTHDQLDFSYRESSIKSNRILLLYGCFSASVRQMNKRLPMRRMSILQK
jgi:UDP-N-acetylmuramate dehydrogenase